jgi:hypothetical protein
LVHADCRVATVDADEGDEDGAAADDDDDDTDVDADARGSESATRQRSASSCVARSWQGEACEDPGRVRRVRLLAG